MDGGEGPWTDKSGPTGGCDELNNVENLSKNDSGTEFKPNKK